MVECICPKLNQTIADPSCGTGGFFLGALEYIHKTNKKISENEAENLKFNTFYGWEIVNETARLCLMNLFLHGIGDLINTPEIQVVDSLKDEPKKKFDIILANPPLEKVVVIFLPMTGKSLKKIIITTIVEIFGQRQAISN